MLEVLPESRLTHVITWEVKNFLDYPFQFAEDLKSPEILIKCLDLTIWKLFLYLSRDEMITCVIRRMDDNKTISRVDVDYSICLVGERNVDYFINTGKFAATIHQRSSHPFHFTSLNSLQNNHLRENALVIRGNLIFAVDKEKILQRVLNNHLIKLSIDFSHLLQNGLFSDLTLKCGETRVNVHKCILSVRWPYAVALDSTMQVSHMSPEVLDVILKCVYFQAMIQPHFNLMSELLISTRKCQFSDLECSLKSFPVECHIVTPMNQEMLIFNYDLTLIATWPESYHTHARILPISDLTVKDLIVNFSLRKDSAGWKYLGISFQFSGFSKYKPIFVACKISLMNTQKERFNNLKYTKTFQKDEEWNLPPYFTEERYPSRIAHEFKTLRCEVIMCDGVDEVKEEFVSSRYVVNRPKYLINDLTKHSDSLYTLFQNSSYSDVDLLVRGIIIKSHKAIISSRSPWFKNCLINMENNSTERCIIVLNDFSFDIVKMVLVYIYSGRIDNQNREIFPEFLSAAVFFELSLLERDIREAMDKSL